MNELIPISRTALWTGRVLSGIVIIFLLLDGAIKMIPLDVVIETSKELGIPTNLAFTLGVLTLACTLLYAIPQTSVLGAVLLTGYLGGALETPFDLRGEQSIMTIITIIAILLALLIAGLLIAASMRPDTFRVQRSIDIDAPADKIYPLISDYKHWASWSPYEKMDPAMRRTFAGAPSGKGAVYEWDGNKNIGRGRMEIIDAMPPSKIGIKLDFFSPFEAHNIAEFTMLPKGDATNVTWAMHGPVPFVAKIMHMMFSMDRMVGGQFEEGLANMKAVAER